jgi:hypothetical protein
MRSRLFISAHQFDQPTRKQKKGQIFAEIGCGVILRLNRQKPEMISLDQSGFFHSAEFEKEFFQALGIE